MLICLRQQAGSSLVEMMIAMVLGLSSLSALCSFVGYGVGMNARLLTSSRLNEEVKVISALMSTDIARAGFDGLTSQRVSDPGESVRPFVDSVALSAYPGESPNSCITFAYDRNHNGLLDTLNGNENYGYRLHDHAIEMRVDGATCDSGGWHDLTDSQVVRITSLQFTLHKQQAGMVTQSRVDLLLVGSLVKDSDISRQVNIRFAVNNYDL
ncbi:MAG: prepilin peptidase dependent protein B [Paraglaciecola sp.]|jgi:prepilin peptidase dependent protein B